MKGHILVLKDRAKREHLTEKITDDLKLNLEQEMGDGDNEVLPILRENALSPK